MKPLEWSLVSNAILGTLCVSGLQEVFAGHLFWLVSNTGLLLLLTIPMLTLSRCDALEFKRELFLNQSEFSKCKEAAFKFATEKRILIQRIERPNVVQVDRAELHRITKLPQLSGKRLHGACDFRGKTIYVCSVLDLDVLRHEYGHWFFGASEEMADAFMEYVGRK